jgi:glycogen(starch) synthase
MAKTSKKRKQSTDHALLVECAWEVCQQLGGIYTVLRTRAKTMVEKWGERYVLLGPHHADTTSLEFEPEEPTGAIAFAIDALRDRGVGARFGRWLVIGRPQVVLLNFLDVFPRLHEVKYYYWEHHRISLPGDDAMMNDVVAFGEATRLFLTALTEYQGDASPVVAHFHEWMAGAAIPELRRQRWPGRMVFTTHATLLGRYLAMNDPQFHEHLPHYHGPTEATKYNIQPQHGLECAAAHGSHVFTTVSDVTARECKQLLGREPDVLLPNGINIQRFLVMHEFQNMHRVFKQKIHEFTMGHFFPTYHFDLDKTIYFFTSGRYEVRNKGMDLTIEALARLNHRLKEAKSPMTVVAFIVTRRPFKSINVTALQSSAMLDEFRTSIEHIKDELGEKLFEAAVAGKIPELDEMIDEYWLLRLRRAMQAWRRGFPPGIVTHDLIDDANDQVLNQLRGCRLWNNAEDRVKVVYHPDFITPSNPLFGLEYEQFVRGCHLGVFPSYYEPWGYTPLESVALGVPAITSDLSGFGSFLQQHHKDHEEHGLFVLHRANRNFEDTAGALTNYLFRFTQQNRRERIALRNKVEAFSEHFDWSKLATHYDDAHERAMATIGPG